MHPLWKSTNWPVRSSVSITCASWWTHESLGLLAVCKVASKYVTIHHLCLRPITAVRLHLYMHPWRAVELIQDSCTNRACFRAFKYMEWRRDVVGSLHAFSIYVCHHSSPLRVQIVYLLWDWAHRSLTVGCEPLNAYIRDSLATINESQTCRSLS